MKLAEKTGEEVLGGGMLQCNSQRIVSTTPKTRSTYSKKKSSAQPLSNPKDAPMWWMTWPATCGRSVVNKVEELVEGIAAFTADLAKELTDFIAESLPTPEDIIQMVGNIFNFADGLCLRPSCSQASHINTGDHEQLFGPAGTIGKTDDLTVQAAVKSIYRPRPPTHHLLVYASPAPADCHSRGSPQDGSPNQAKTSLSACFNMYDFKLLGGGLADAIVDFWENNPVIDAFQLVKMGPVDSVLWHPRVSYHLP